MSIVLALLWSLFRFTGYFTEPRLSDAQIHTVSGEPSRVMWPLADDRPLRIVTWNIERGIKFDRVAHMLASLDADVILLQEADRFCSRSGDRDVPRDLAITLRMNFVTGGEFQEIGEGSRGRPCVSGQAILSRAPIEDPATLRFADQASWKWTMNPAQPRRGGRIALRARAGDVVFYSVHLESGDDEQRRANQVRDITVDAATRHGATIVGGDFNNAGSPDTAMFSPLRSGGFINAMPPHRQEARRPIDWIYSRGLCGIASPVLAPGASDHDPVVFQSSVQPRF